MQFFKSLLWVLTAFVLVNCNEASPKKDNTDEKVIYSIAYDMGTKLQTFQLSAHEMKVFQKGLKDGLDDKRKPEVEVKKEIVNVGKLVKERSKKFADKEKKASESFLATLEKADGAQKTESGLIYKETQAGTGAVPKATDKVKVHYHGTLRNGEVFDSSKDRGQPATFPLNGVIPCWTEGVQKMKVGGKAVLGCPAEIAYKDRGAPPVIKPGAALKFEVELLEIVKAEGPKAAPKKPTKKK